MKKLFSSLSILFGVALGVGAHAQQLSDITFTASPIDGFSLAAAPSVQYAGIPGPYFAAPAARGLLGFDDYTVANPVGDWFHLTSLRFVGGVQFGSPAPGPADRALQFEFYTAGGALANVIAGALPQSGNFIWNLNLNAPILVPTDGIFALRTFNSGATAAPGQWFLTSTAPSVGTNDPNFGGGTNGAAPLFQAFEFTGQAVPEPGSVALLAGVAVVGAGALLRRRRTK